MKTKLLILFAFLGLSSLIPHALGQDMENADTIQDFDKTFSINQQQVKYVIPYEISNGIVDDMKLNCDPPSLAVSISSSDAGVLRLDIPHRMLSGIFMLLVDGVEWVDEGETSIEGHTLTVNFPANTNTIEIMGSYYISSNKDGACDVFHNPPYSYILSPLKQFKSGILIDEIICKEDLKLIQKYNGSPACVTPSTAEKLIERGWIKPPIEPNTGEFRYGKQECHYVDANGQPNYCIVEGWTKPASELDCEEICKPPPEKE